MTNIETCACFEREVMLVLSSRLTFNERGAECGALSHFDSLGSDYHSVVGTMLARVLGSKFVSIVIVLRSKAVFFRLASGARELESSGAKNEM